MVMVQVRKDVDDAAIDVEDAATDAVNDLSSVATFHHFTMLPMLLLPILLLLTMVSN
jgi:hypothetical protein